MVLADDCVAQNVEWEVGGEPGLAWPNGRVKFVPQMGLEFLALPEDGPGIPE